MTTIERPPLGALSVNTLKRAHTDIVKPSLPRLKNIVPHAALLSRENSITKPQTYTNHARKLKYRLKLAYYKLQTDQVGVPLAEIIKKHTDNAVSKPSSGIFMTKSADVLAEKKMATTPSLTRHISLLGASTPLQANGFAPILPKKSVAFKRSNTLMDPSCFTVNEKKTRASLPSLPRIAEYPTFKVNRKAIRTNSSPQLERSAPHNRFLKIEDLVDRHGSSTQNSSTPIKSITNEHGDLLLSSPTKKVCSSTPGSYGAAKSLLQLSALLGSN